MWLNYYTNTVFATSVDSHIFSLVWLSRLRLDEVAQDDDDRRLKKKQKTDKLYTHSWKTNLIKTP